MPVGLGLLLALAGVQEIGLVVQDKGLGMLTLTSNLYGDHVVSQLNIISRAVIMMRLQCAS